MPFVTVAALKAAVAAIPAGANSWELDMPPDLLVAAVNNRTTDASGNQFYTIKGYVHFDTLTWDAVQ